MKSFQAVTVAFILALAPAAMAQDASSDAGGATDVEQDTASEADGGGAQDTAPVETDGETPVTDAGPGEEDGGPVVTDAGPTVDADPTEDAGPAVDVSVDAGGGGPLNENPCWDEKCPEETSACKGDAFCAEVVGCIIADDADCIGSIQEDHPDSWDLYIAMEQCGYAACANPDGQSCEGKCGNFDQTWPCNCDDLCTQYGDCCADWEALCGGGGPVCTPDCAGKECGSDGCEGTCGDCDAGEACNAGVCEAEGCQDECTEGDNSCAGGQAFSCVKGPDGCWSKAADNCVGKDMICVDGACVEDTGTPTGNDGEDAGTSTGTGPADAGSSADTSGAGNSGGGGNSSSSGGCSATPGGAGTPLVLSAALLLLLAWRRKDD